MAPDNEPTQDFATKRIAATFPRSQWIYQRGLNPASSIRFLSLLGKLSGRTEAHKINWHDGGGGWGGGVKGLHCTEVAYWLLTQQPWV